MHPFAIPFFIIYLWLTKILPFFIAIFIGITLLISCFRMGMKAGLTVIATVASVFIALYIINGKEVVTKSLNIFKKTFSLSLSEDGKLKSESDE